MIARERQRLMIGAVIAWLGAGIDRARNLRDEIQS
jgi:hypothetical protein